MIDFATFIQKSKQGVIRYSFVIETKVNALTVYSYEA